MRERLLRLLYPPKCVLCHCMLREGETDLCESCRSWIEQEKQGYALKGEFMDGGFACYPYTGSVRESIHRYKFRGRKLYAAFYAQHMASVALAHPELFDCDLVTAVPTNRSNRRRRGYDHALLLGQAVASRLGKPYLTTLAKNRETTAMYGLKPAERRANILGAVDLACSPEQIAGKRVLMTDDIFTTGATAGECARVLKMAGASKVTVLTFAKSGKDVQQVIGNS